MSKDFTRRNFLRSATVALAATGLTRPHIVGANERVGVGFIGLGNRGDQLLDAFLENSANCQVVALCDVFEPYLEFAARKVGGSPRRYQDYRRLLEDKSVDAVVIATPDHWHALQFVDSCRAGKDAYVEKPASLTVVEGRKMVEAARQHNRVAQVGIQRRSSDFCREACELVRHGGIGQVTVVRSFHVLQELPLGIGNPPDGDPPPGLDWDMWLGPAPKVPYNPNRCFYKFRWFWDYSGGQVTNMGTHYMDLIHWALGKDAPRSVTAIGGKFAGKDNRETPDTCEVLWEYEGPTLVTFSQYNCNAAPCAWDGALLEFRGSQGTLYITSQGYEIVPEQWSDDPVSTRNPAHRASERRAPAHPAMAPKQAKGRMADSDHVRNFLECVKSRQHPSCDIEIGHRSTSATLIANVALRTRRHLDWDATAERFSNDDAANRLLAYHYRAPWRLG